MVNFLVIKICMINDSNVSLWDMGDDPPPVVYIARDDNVGSVPIKEYTWESDDQMRGMALCCGWDNV